MQSRYILLTGGKNNAGDFLIKYKAKRLFKEHRKDREIIDWDGWKPLTEEQVDIINDSKALILMGGPSMQGNMYPGVYPLVEDLSRIKVPILTMGVGYKEESGLWQNTGAYLFSRTTSQLLNRINSAVYNSSVRDYHTLNVLLSKKLNAFIMTGCPALYEPDMIGKPIHTPDEYKTIAFSLGVSYLQSSGMNFQMKALIEKLRKQYPKAKITVYFHHKINLQNSLQKEWVEWLDNKMITYEDISGSETRMVEVYSNCDIHIGYRVHAHVHASSMGRPSILINEDSRGKGFYTVMGGMILDGYFVLPRFNRPDASLLYKSMGAVKKLYSLMRIDSGLESYSGIPDDVIQQMEYEKKNNFPRTRVVRSNIDLHYEEMKRFIASLP